MSRWLIARRISLTGLAAAAALLLGTPSIAQAQTAPAAPAYDISLTAVSCADATHCLAVGSRTALSGPAGGPFAQTWNGRAWRVITVPNPGKNAGLDAVACTAPGACMAVGGYNPKTGSGLLAMRWNGMTWRVLPVPGPALSQFSAISCSGPASCVAVGDSFGTGVRRTLAEGWNGKVWRTLPAANTHSGDAQLLGVSCTGPASCMAVGTTYTSADVTDTLAEQWNGRNWVITRTASPANNLNVLQSVSCVKAQKAPAATCIATGFDLNRFQAFSAPIADKWTGASWQVRKPHGPGRGSSLLSVSCPAASGCVAVGGEAGPAGGLPVSQTWNGTAWQVVATAAAGAGSAANLIAISCPLASRCVAVGQVFTGSGPVRPFAQEWNGVRWRII